MERSELAFESAGANGSVLVVGEELLVVEIAKGPVVTPKLLGLILVVVILVVVAIGCGPPF